MESARCAQVASAGSPCVGGLDRGAMARSGASPPGGRSSLPRQRVMRRCTSPFAFQCAFHRSRPARRRLAVRSSFRQRSLCRSACLRRSASLRRRGQLHSGAPRLRQADGDGLLRRSCAVFSAAYVLDLFVNELAGLSRWRLALSLVRSCALDGFLLGHRTILPRQIRAYTPPATVR
jgi:hypothetical protein